MAIAHTLLTDGAHADHRAFWAATLGAASGDFHARQPWLSRPVATQTVMTADCPISPEAASVVADLGKGKDLGTFVVCAGALALVLRQHTRAATVVMDTPPLAGAEPGHELLPLVAAPDGAETLRAFLARFGERVGGTFSFAPFPVSAFSDAVLQQPRPATNVALTFEGLQAATPAAGDYDLHVTVAAAPALRIRLTGRAPAFSVDYLQALARHLARALEAFAQRDTRIDDVDLLDDAERARLLVDCNPGRAGGTVARTIHSLFEEVVAARGGADAVVLHDTSLTYDTLNQRANQLARFLQTEYGVQRGDVIGVVTHRSPDTIAAILGVLKAGAVYLPIDPDYPEERLTFLVSDASVKVLLVQSEHFERLMALYETPMFALDIQLATLETDAGNLGDTCAPTDLAYIIYTSGSTGRPKGVLLEHAGFATMIRHHVETFGVTPDETLLQFYGQSFDSSLFEIFMALLSGATLVMVDRDTINDPAQLSAYVAAQGVTMLTMPPVYVSTLARASLAGVRRYVSAGDHCRVEDALQLAAVADYYNSYGPTETSVCVTHYKVDPAQPYGARIPIGVPISGTSIYLLDERLRPVPFGVVGEICIGGAGLARGYLNRDDLTAAAFVPSPFDDGGRLYRTGDLGAWLPDGNLEVIGRRDHQVKIRGYRVEPGEIESVLDQHPAVKEAAVIAREDEQGHKRLAAYVTAAGAIDIADLKTLIRARLPEFMMPSAFTVLDAMPLTANGKIDRRALDALVETAAAAEPGAGLPQNAVQATLVRIWQDVLGVERVGIHDNVFDLGGDSILIIQIVARAREAGLKLAPNQLFDHQTVAALAEVAIAADPAAAVAAEQGPIEGPTPLAPMQAWFFERRFADAHHFNQSVCLEAAGGIDAAAAEGATRAIVAHHDALRLRFSERGGEVWAEYGPVPGSASFEIVDLSSAPAGAEDAAIRTAVERCQSGFDLAAGPLLKVALLRPGNGRPSRLVFVAHHLAVDGVSWRVLLGDFSTAYAQIAAGKPVALPAKTSSFRTWTSRVAAVASTMRADYWLNAPAVDAAPLPVDRDRAEGLNTKAAAGDVTRTLDAATTAALLQDVPRAYATEITDVLLAGLALTFREWTGDSRLLIDLEAHGREELVDDVDVSRTVGWFTAQFPLQLEIDGDATPAGAIRAVKEQLRAVPYRGAGYGALRYLSRDAGIAAALAGRPAPEVLFNYFGQAGRVLAPELQWTLVPGGTHGDISPRNERAHLLEINGMVADGCLTLTWTFCEAIHDRATIAALAARYEDRLRLLVEHSRSAGPQYTPSDFPAAGLDQKSLDALVAKLSK